jgi:limonene-1,2-epoxide hydrolase
MDVDTDAPTPGEVVRRFIGCLNTFDLEGAQHLVAGDFVWENVSMDPPADRLEGGAAMAHRLGAVFERCDRIDWQILEQAEAGDTVLNERVDHHWFDRALFPVQNHLAAKVAGIWKVRDGRIALWRDYNNLGEFEQQLGMTVADFGRIIGRDYGRDARRDVSTGEAAWGGA